MWNKSKYQIQIQIKLVVFEIIWRNGSDVGSFFRMVRSLALFAFAGLEYSFLLFDLIEPNNNFEFHDFLFQDGLLLLEISVVFLNHFIQMLWLLHFLELHLY